MEICSFKKINAKSAVKKGIAARHNKIEGDKCTPRGRFKFKYIFYRKERVKKINSKLKLIPIKKNFGWCDDSKSKNYNKFVKLPFKYSAEKLYLKKNTYDIVVVINYNLKPVKKNKGSAIFIHLSSKDYTPTLGCVALLKRDLKKLIAQIDKNTYLKIL